MSSFKSTYATDNRVESTIHIISHYLRAATNKLGAKKADTDYFVMTDKLVEELINSYQNRDAKSALVVDDIGLQVINRLIQECVKDITLALTRVPKENLEIVKYIIHNTFQEFNIKIVLIEETEGMNVDLVIANPPYGKIGAEITKKIIDTVDFKEYVNLLPANDYKRVNGLWNYQSDMRALDNYRGEIFADAAVTTHLAKIHKTKINNMTLDEFERSQYIDRQLDKYFEENSKRKHYAIDKIVPAGYGASQIKNIIAWDCKKTFIIGLRDINHKHMPYSKNCVTYKWNVNEELDFNYILNNCLNTNGWLLISDCQFNTEIEKQNFVRFIYQNFKFTSKVFTALNCDGGVKSIAFPKVDWTRSWTVEEILKDYGYTEDEIKEVMDDLKNYKGMED